MSGTTKFPKPDPKFAYWHGIDRTKIPWYPTIDEDRCIGCKLCFVSCGRNVFDFDEKRKKAVVAKPYNCMVGCSTCATICPSQAISFPDKEIVHKIEREEKILAKIQKKAREKKLKLDLEKIRNQVVESISKARTKASYQIVGHILEQKIFEKLMDAVADCPVDIVDIKINSPSLKGCWNLNAPSVAEFVVVSTEMEDITPCLDKVDEVIDRTGAIVVKKE